MASKKNDQGEPVDENREASLEEGSLVSKDNLEEKKEAPDKDSQVKEVVDTKEIIRKLYAMHQDLEQKLQYIDQNLHHIPEELKELAKQPEKIIQDHDEIVARYEQELEEKVVGAIGKSLYFGYKKSKKKKKSKRGRKLQKLRGRKKWIPMQ
ncbi:MAG: hypothetical protein VX777_06815 [Chlamydiota bacterium]|nr:hypothetical protein [Chlamydiota bacterium]